jgi:hypothetical protein
MRNLTMSLATAFALVMPFAGHAVPLPFSDGFESNQGVCAAWTRAFVDGANSISAVTSPVHSGLRSGRAFYAGADNTPAAACVIDFAPVTRLFARFWVFFPAGTSNALPRGDSIRIARISDVTTAVSPSGNSKLRLEALKGDATSVWLGLNYVNTAGGTSVIGESAATAVKENAWHLVLLTYEPSLPSVQIFIDDERVPKASAKMNNLPAYNFQTFWLGIANLANTNRQVTFYVDDADVSGAPLAPWATDAGVDAGGNAVPDAGGTQPADAGNEFDAGVPPSNRDASVVDSEVLPEDGSINLLDAGSSSVPDAALDPREFDVGCGCGSAPLFSAAVLLMALWRVRLTRRPR